MKQKSHEEGVPFHLVEEPYVQKSSDDFNFEQESVQK